MKPPYAFTGPYADCYSVPKMAIDVRHVYMLHGVLTGSRFKETLEIGSCFGASSTAFVEAVNGGTVARATFSDIDLTDSLLRVLSNAIDPCRVRLTREASWDVLESADDFDLIFVDANHDLDSVTKELNRLVPRQPRCVVAHDTNATAAGHPRCEGAMLLKQTFAAMPGYQCIEDCKSREGERTHRGLFLATRDPDLFQVAEAAFAAWA